MSTVYLVSAFCLLSATGQMYYFAGDAFAFLSRSARPSAYARLLQQGGVNFFRYLEYSVSASVMLVLIAMQVGIWDWGVLAGVAVGVWSCMMFGMLSDVLLHMRHAVPSQPVLGYAWAAHVCGWVALGAPFWVLWASFVKQRPPERIYIILVTETVLFAFFGLTQVFQLCASSYEDRALLKRGKVVQVTDAQSFGVSECLRVDIHSILRSEDNNAKPVEGGVAAATPVSKVQVVTEFAYLVQSCFSKILLVFLVYSLVLFNVLDE
eukprot:2330866-Rhodomonas_salina.6